MSDDDSAFSVRVISTRDLPRPRIIKTVGDAIDFVDEMPNARALPHWQQAHSALHQAYERPDDASRTKAAEGAFRAAMKKEGWLIEPPPPNPIGVDDAFTVTPSRGHLLTLRAFGEVEDCRYRKTYPDGPMPSGSSKLPAE